MDTKERHRTAVHESIHALLALPVATVHQVRCYPVGQTEVAFPFTPSSLYLHYHKKPEATHRQLIKVLAVIVGPHVLQGSPLEAGDDVADWQAAYNTLSNAALHWKSIIADVHQYVRAWYRAPGRADLVEKVSQALVKRAVVNGDKNWRALVASCQPARQAPRSTRNIDMNRAVENIRCLQESLCDWRTVGRAGIGVLQSYL
jgi:hypothetical protein